MITFLVQQSEAACYESTTYGATEGEEGLGQLILWEEGMPCHQIDESAKSTSPPLNELTLRDRGQDCGQIPEKANIYRLILVGQKCTMRRP